MKQRGTVFITGASGGIGVATAWHFASKGYPVALGCFRNWQVCESLCEALSKKGYAAMVCRGDVSVEHEVERMFTEIESTLGPVMVLVNNAGHSDQKLFVDLSVAEWDRMFAVHVRGSFLCSKRAAKKMIQEKRGNIIQVSSMWGQVGASCEVHYAAAKAAVIGFTKSLAKELALSNIRVNCVAPGVIDTAMMEDFDADDVARLCEQTPMGRLGSAKEVAEAIVFLASEESSFFTGQVLCPNGGFVV